MVHVHIQATREESVEAEGIAFASTNVHVYSRLKGVDPSKKNVQSFEFVIGDENGKIKDEIFVKSFGTFVNAINGIRRKNNGSKVVDWT